MGFRRPKSSRHAKDRAWRTWLSAHECELKAAGLSAGVMLSEDHWIDFLQNGRVEWRHPEANDGFSFDQLSAKQMSDLLVILEASPQYASEPMVGWLRHRLGRATAG